MNKQEVHDWYRGKLGEKVDERLDECLTDCLQGLVDEVTEQISTEISNKGSVEMVGWLLEQGLTKEDLLNWWDGETDEHLGCHNWPNCDTEGCGAT